MNENGFLIMSIALGIIFIIISFVLKDKGNKKELREDVEEEMKPDSNFLDHEEMIAEIDHKIFELNDYSSFIKKELNDKHKELLFLYQLITEKEKNINKLAKTSIRKLEEGTELAESIIKPQTMEFQEEIVDNTIKNSNKEIFDLYEKGYSVTDIAKTLAIGKGEVKLILDLGINKRN